MGVDKGKPPKWHLGSIMVQGTDMKLSAALMSIVATGIGIFPMPSVLARPGPAAIFASTRKLPDDVVAFRARRDRCDQLRGEEPTDGERAALLSRELDRMCKGTDIALANLRKRYADSHLVVEALAAYDSAIE